MNTYEIDANGAARDRQSYTLVATFEESGQIKTPNYQYMGRVDPDGTVWDSENRRLGRVDSDGTVYTDSNQQVGRVEPPNVHRHGALMLLL